MHLYTNTGAVKFVYLQYILFKFGNLPTQMLSRGFPARSGLMLFTVKSSSTLRRQLAPILDTVNVIFLLVQTILDHTNPSESSELPRVRFLHRNLSFLGPVYLSTL